MWEEFAEEILGQDTHVPLDLVVENQSRCNGRLVLPAPSPSPFSL